MVEELATEKEIMLGEITDSIFLVHRETIDNSNMHVRVEALYDKDDKNHNSFDPILLAKMMENDTEADVELSR